MAKYRIKKHEGFYGVSYEVQKKIWYIPFWYNFENIDGWSTGFYGTEKEAKEAIERDRFKTIKSFINVD